MFYGRGAGADATSSAVISDLADAALNLKFGSNQRVPAFVSHRLNARVRPIDEVESRYYLRLTVEDCSGVIAKVSQMLGDADISIASVLQREAPEARPGQSEPIMGGSLDYHATHREGPHRAGRRGQDRPTGRRQGPDRSSSASRASTTARSECPAHKRVDHMNAWRGVIEQYRKHLPVTDKTPSYR